MGFGKLLKEKMQAKNVKQSELSAALGIPKTTLSSMINRDNMKVDIEMLLKICDYLECNPEEFYQDYIKNKKSPPPENKWGDLEEQLNTLSDSEKSTIKKYRELDVYGKEVVDSILNIEYKRCTSAAPASNISTSKSKNHDIIEMKRAARDGRKISTEMITREEANAIKNMPDTPENL